MNEASDCKKRSVTTDTRNNWSGLQEWVVDSKEIRKWLIFIIFKYCQCLPPSAFIRHSSYYFSHLAKLYFFSFFLVISSIDYLLLSVKLQCLLAWCILMHKFILLSWQRFHHKCHFQGCYCKLHLQKTIKIEINFWCWFSHTSKFIFLDWYNG